MGVSYLPRRVRVDFIQHHQVLPWGNHYIIAWRNGEIVDYVDYSWFEDIPGEFTEVSYQDSDVIVDALQVVHTSNGKCVIKRYFEVFPKRKPARDIWHPRSY